MPHGCWRSTRTGAPRSSGAASHYWKRRRPTGEPSAADLAYLTDRVRQAKNNRFMARSSSHGMDDLSLRVGNRDVATRDGQLLDSHVSGMPLSIDDKTTRPRRSLAG